MKEEKEEQKHTVPKSELRHKLSETVNRSNFEPNTFNNGEIAEAKEVKHNLNENKEKYKRKI